MRGSAFEGTRAARDLKIDCPDAAKILQNNVYGWFVRIERGFYALTAAGRAALVRCNPDLPARSAARSESVLAAE